MINAQFPSTAGNRFVALSPRLCFPLDGLRPTHKSMPQNIQFSYQPSRDVIYRSIVTSERSAEEK